jgi:hypothetical protein
MIDLTKALNFDSHCIKNIVATGSRVKSHGKYGGTILKVLIINSLDHIKNIVLQNSTS